MRRRALFPMLILIAALICMVPMASQAQDKVQGKQPEQQAQQQPQQGTQPEEVSQQPQQGTEQQPQQESQAPKPSDPSKMNINTADAAQLVDLPGIGPAIAQAIIEHREAKGPFKTVEDIQNVKGIGPKKFEAIKDKIAVE